MCLAIPMQILSVSGNSALCQVGGIQREVSLFLMQHESLMQGDFVMVHVGYAIQKVQPEQAHLAWQLHDAMMAADHDNA